jgi:hypothetical protein
MNKGETFLGKLMKNDSNLCFRHLGVEQQWSLQISKP